MNNYAFLIEKYFPECEFRNIIPHVNFIYYEFTRKNKDYIAKVGKISDWYFLKVWDEKGLTILDQQTKF